MNKLHTPSAHKPIEVLVIEDNTLVRKVVCQLLTLYGYKTDAAATGKLGIQMAQQHQYDCILVDFGLPDINADGIARALRAFEHTRNKTPCHMVVLSASVDEAQTHLCLAAGIDQVFSKPLNAGIIEKIDIALSKH